eukprot:NODE_138_length_17968_cov_0.291175.p1 type:complete len:1256 gc:universal NODE_138_length_17968_cov_0.291175:6910-3143(-)
MFLQLRNDDILSEWLSYTSLTLAKQMQFPTDFATTDHEILASVSKTYSLIEEPFSKFAMALIVILSRHCNPNIEIGIDKLLFKCAVSDTDTCQDILEHLKLKSNYSNATSAAGISLVSSSKSSSPVEFSIEMLPNIKKLQFKANLSYNSAIYLQDRMNDILNQIDLVLRVPLTTEVFKINLITDLASSVLPVPTSDLHWNEWPGSIVSIFRSNSESHPDSTCVVDDFMNYSYGDIFSLSNKVSHFLTNSKLSKGDVCTVFAYRGVELVIAIMGILGANLTVNIIDPLYPSDRQIIYLKVAQPKAVIHIDRSGELQPSVLAFINDSNPNCFLTNFSVRNRSISSTPSIDDISSTPLPIDIGPEDIATLSFTSGSTGIPKGVLGRHYSLTHYYPWMSDKFCLSKADRFTMLSGIAHDPIQRDIFTPLFLGAQLHIPSVDVIHNGLISKWVNDNQLSVTHLTPAMGQLVVNNAVSMPCLKNAFFVGDVLTRRDVTKLQRVALNASIINMYGTTETQRSVSYFLIPNKHEFPSFLLSKHIMSAGIGMNDVQLLILNNNSKLCSIGELGEIYIRSGGLAKGYKEDSDVLSTAKFVVNPFTNNSYDRCYKTGDLARYLPNGHAECIGRMDDQIKIRGFRIELGEIDIHLSNYPLIKSNITLIKRDENEEHVLVSYVVLKDSHENAIESIKKHLCSVLPSYSIPNIFILLPFLPLTPNGKIDKNALPIVNPPTSPSYESMTYHESQLSQILNKLKLSIKLNDDFFTNGMHSILATRFLYECNLVNIIIKMNDLYKFNTIHKLAQHVMNSEDEYNSGYETEKNDESYRLKVPVLRNEIDLINKASRQLLLDYKPVSTGIKHKSVFLTGSTGYLGSFILNELLVNKCTVYCLIRGNDLDHCKSKLITAMKQYGNEIEDGLIHSSVDERIPGPCVVVVRGDLSLPLLGLSDSLFNSISVMSDVVIHNGALVHWVYPYNRLEASNVNSTVEAYRISCNKKIKPLIFISSTSVLGNDGTVVHEGDSLASHYPVTGYGQSKWTSECILKNQPLPTNIIRPGYIVGHSVKGYTNTDDFIFRMVKGSQVLKCAPIISNHINMCTVDYVSSVVLASVDSAMKYNNVFMTWQSTDFTFTDLFGYCANYMDIIPIEYKEWKTRLQMNVNDVLMPLLHFVTDDLPSNTKGVKLNDDNCKKLIASILSRDGILIENKSIQSCIRRMLGYLISVGYIKCDDVNRLSEWQALVDIKHEELPHLDMWEHSRVTQRSRE